MNKQAELARHLAALDVMPRRENIMKPVTDAQAAEARRYIASGRPTKLANGGTVFTHGKEG